jgi:hypothetical protein
VVIASFVVGSVGAAYLWAVVFGHGLRGLKSSAALDRQPGSADFRDANVAAGLAIFGATVLIR